LRLNLFRDRHAALPSQNKRLPAAPRRAPMFFGPTDNIRLFQLREVPVLNSRG